ncbi:hypothetical protein VTK73DRAFT_703 [Phialemonium thermophilum]|uniref:Enoyl reductase (ER) domain-containing protein n=1 Tax=Phialemonium thermophilum TaxID=223376 RepID=A0ABR3VUL5_9PEZI
MSIPSQIKAITVAPGGGPVISTVAPPTPRDGYVIVRTTAVALNPTDWKAAANRFGVDCTGCRVGCDYAGVVVQADKTPAGSRLKVGTRVAGMVHGVNKGQPEDGAFAEYIVAKAGLQILIPDTLSDTAAATLGVGISTVGQALYQTLGLPLPLPAPPASGKTILVYGGSTATGILGIQFARLSGYRVVTTCSPRNFEYVKSLGADEVVDYSDPEVCAAKIREFAGGELDLVFDCVSTPEAIKISLSAMAPRGGKYVALMYVDQAAVKAINPNVSVTTPFAYTIFGEAFEKFRRFKAVPEDFEFGVKFWAIAEELLAAGKIEPARQDVNRGGKGLEGVLVGLEELKQNKVSGVKLVYTL